MRSSIMASLVGRLRRVAMGRHFRKVLLLVMVFLGGWFSSKYETRFEERLLQLYPDTFDNRVKNYVQITYDLGFDHFRSCRAKVEDLHRRIAAADTSQTPISSHNSAELGKLVTSIILEGRGCNPYLAKFARSDRPLPRIPMPYVLRHLRMAYDFRQIAPTEGELMVWLLDRLNPEYRFTLSAAQEISDPRSGWDKGDVTAYWVAVGEGNMEHE